MSINFPVSDANFILGENLHEIMKIITTTNKKRSCISKFWG